MGSINSEEIISILKTEIENYDMVSGEQEVGSVIWVGDGIATIYGIEHAMYGEIVIFENGIRGMVQDIRRDQIGCIILGKDTEIKDTGLLVVDVVRTLLIVFGALFVLSLVMWITRKRRFKKNYVYAPVVESAEKKSEA